jgi:hypothetical protein
VAYFNAKAQSYRCTYLQLQDLKMEAISSSETVVTTYKTTGRSIAGNYISKYYYPYAFLDKINV